MQPVGTCSTTVMPPETDGATSALFHEHMAWAASIARNVRRKLPPSFHIDDLEQEARVEHWRRVQLWNPSTGVPYRAYAYFAIRGAILMSCRRRHYRDATHDELKQGATLVDTKLRSDELMLAHEEQRVLAGSRIYLQRLRVLMALGRLPVEDADLVRRVLGGADEFEFDHATKRQLSKAVQRLKRELARGPPPAERVRKLVAVPV